MGISCSKPVVNKSSAPLKLKQSKELPINRDPLFSVLNMHSFLSDKRPAKSLSEIATQGDNHEDSPTL